MRLRVALRPHEVQHPFFILVRPMDLASNGHKGVCASLRVGPDVTVTPVLRALESAPTPGDPMDEGCPPCPGLSSPAQPL